MIRPPLLKRGDTIGIVAPARKVNKSQVEKAIAVFREWGLNVTAGKYLLADEHSYLAATDNHRLEDFQSFVDDKSIKAIISARGGYGSTRILDLIDFSNFLSAPKWIIGFSDITAIHLRLIKHQFLSVHGTMPILFAKAGSEPSIESLQNILFKGNFLLSASGSSFNRPGSADGSIVGGNLSLIVDSLGTSSEIQTEGCILVIEEIDEYFYRFDRLMTQLRRAGKLQKLAGLVVGYTTDMKDSELAFGEPVEEIIMNATRGYGYPVGFNFPTGHENPNLAWIHGAHSILKVELSGSSLQPSQKKYS
jgi:muramoyltetrapeptide carboxypeptidase